MNVVLVNPPNHQYDIDDLAPPLGQLMLAETLAETDAELALIDLNLESCAGTLPSPLDFYRVVCDRIFALAPNVVCFTSMGINSHVALELARRLKSIDGSILTVFGGPHFGSIASQLKRSFPWVDYVNVGPGEPSIQRFVRSLERGSRPISAVLGTEAARETRREIHHPWAAYNLIDMQEYFSVNSRRVLDFETGRGCKFRCKFCYSPAHWSERFDFQLSSVLQDFRGASAIGASHLFLVQDNFLNDRDFAGALCLNLAELSPKPTWNCYGTLRDIDDEVVDYLARGGCVGIYIGVDAVTPMQKRQFGKSSFTQKSECVDKVRDLVAHSIVPTCAFILDPLNWSDDELEATFRLATTLRLNGAELSFHFLTKYSSTTLHGGNISAAIPDDFRIRLMFDSPEVVAQNPFVESYPALFPFHTRSSDDSAKYRCSVAMVYLAQHLISRYPHEISDLISSSSCVIVDLLRKIYSVLRPTHSFKRAITRMAVTEVFEEILLKKYGFYPLATKGRYEK